MVGIFLVIMFILASETSEFFVSNVSGSIFNLGKIIIYSLQRELIVHLLGVGCLTLFCPKNVPTVYMERRIYTLFGAGVSVPEICDSLYTLAWVFLEKNMLQK